MKENLLFFAEEKKNKKGKREKYLEKENIFLRRIRKRKMLPKQDERQPNKEKFGYSANGPWKAEMSNLTLT